MLPRTLAPNQLVKSLLAWIAAVAIAGPVTAGPAMAVKHQAHVAPKAPAHASAKKISAKRSAPLSQARIATDSTEKSDALVENVATTPEIGSHNAFTDTINWTKRVVTVLGVGVSPDRGTLDIRRKVAQAYALDDGMSELSELVNNVRVNGDATVADLAVSDDAIRSALDARIAAAKILDSNVLPDGSVQVTLQLPLFGHDGLAGAVLSDEPSPILFASDATPSLPTSAYTGIIIDARQSGAQPALAPAIRSVDGQGLASRPSVAYVHTMMGAADIAGDNPLKLSAPRCAGNTHADLLLSDGDFAKFKDAWSKGGLSLVIVL
ncbi:MAG: hypothetical protein KGR26_04645 [Cyanobacteria bacterium REEB65]|nr:hypothetical protein [Cyanobacteria bacterium REEB65]